MTVQKSPENFKGLEKETEVWTSNILAARGISDFLRTSLGPKGMDKMITKSNKEVIISNDGATLLSNLPVLHPVAKMLVGLSKSQDVETGDGTTSVVILAGALLEESKKLIEKGLHPNAISDAFGRCSEKVPNIVKAMAQPVSLDDDAILTDVAITSLNSKIIAPESPLLAPIAVKAVKSVMTNSKDGNFVDLKNIRLVTKLGGTLEDSELVEGLVFSQKASHQAGGPTAVRNAKIALIQFQLSPPKPDMDFSVSVQKNEDIDRLHKDERRYVAKIVQKIAKSGCNVVLIQKSIIRDAVSPLALDFLARKGIMVVTNVEREDVGFITKSIGCRPIAELSAFTSDKFGSAELVEESKTPDGPLVFVRGVKNPGKTTSILIRGSNDLILQEAERSMHDALCVVRCLVQAPFTVPGGAAAETEVSVKIRQEAEKDGFAGSLGLCSIAFAEALEAVPFTLAENCGLSPVRIVTELRERHQKGESGAGVDVRRGMIANLGKGSKRVIQPALVTLRAITLTVECVQMVLKIDGVVQSARD